MQLSKTLSQAIDRVFAKPVDSLFYVFMALPLLYVPGHHIYFRTLRVFYIIATAVLILSVPSLRARLFKNVDLLGKRGFWLLLTILLFMIASTTTSQLEPALLLLGREPDYMGILAWLSIIVFGLFFARRLQSLLFSPTSLLIMAAVLGGSLAWGARAILMGYRAPGLMMQATTMAMYATLVAAVALHLYLKESTHRRSKLLAVVSVILSVLTVVSTQSRVGYAVLIIVFTHFASRIVRTHKRVMLGLVSVAIGLTLFAAMSDSQHIQRMQAASVHRGVAYRLNIYKVTGVDIIKNNYLLGDGPSALPLSLNNIDEVPEDIAVTLREKLLFVSSHDLFIDMAQYFGLFVGVATFLVCIRVLFVGLASNQLDLKIAFVVLLLNALCNTVSPEMTAMLAMVLFSILVARHHPAAHDGE